ncbi:UNVERIFIED_CONTAM: hypothetical protein FKN15_022542 [Acipenser sinensis]
MAKQSHGEYQRSGTTLHAIALAGLSEYNLPEGYKLSFPVRTNYMYARVRRSIPELYSFSACLWVLSHSSSGIGTPFSYSVPGQANEIVLLQGVHNPVELLINDKVAQLPLQLTESRWHHVCITWTLRDGEWHAYQDGELRGHGDNLAAWHPIRAGGVLILGQEQGVHNPVELLINDKVAQLPLQLTESRWHHVCVTWTLQDGEWHAYQDGELRGHGDNLAAWHPIRAGGVLILGQEQVSSMFEISPGVKPF